MAKKLTVDEAMQRVIDKVNLMKKPESADLEKYMREYSSLRNLSEDEFEEAYTEISERLFGSDEDRFQQTFDEMQEELFEQTMGVTEEEEETEDEAVVETEAEDDAPGTELILLEVLDEEPAAVVEDENKEIPISLVPMTVTVDEVKELAGAVVGGIKMAAEMAGIACHIGAAIGAVAMKAGFAASLGLMDVWYWLTTYIPIGLRWLFLRLIWDVVPAVKKGWTVAWPFMKETAVMLVGLAGTVVLMVAGTTARTCRTVAAGWKLRKEIIAEMAA